MSNNVGAGGTGYQDSRPDLNAYAGHFDDLDDKPVKREKRTVSLFGTLLDRDLLVCKLFYLFFFSAFGSLFPLISIYFKQLGMNATQAGLLVGLRPFVEFGSIPFWSSFADKFRQGKKLLLFCLLSWIVSTYLLNYMRPPTTYCLKCEMPDKDTDVCKMEPFKKQEMCEIVRGKDTWDADKAPDKAYEMQECGPTGISPFEALNEVPADNRKEYMNDGPLLRPRYSARIYLASGVEQSFVLLLLIVCIGEFLSSPAVSLADGCTLSYLTDQPDHYGRQRLFGSMGWALSMFLMGIILDSTEFPNHLCGLLEAHEKNYTVCFATFTFFMACAMVVATQFTFPSDGEAFATRPDEVAAKLIDTQAIQVDAKRAQITRQETVMPVETGRGPKFIGVLKTFRAPTHLMFLFVTWWLGMGVGLVFSFLFWHLQDVGGSPLLFGIASVVNHVSELIAYFYSFAMINKHGHLKILYVGLAANAVRFLYISLIPNAWFVLPIELLQGLTHATVWSAASTYISLVAPAELKSDAQHMISGLHHGIGRGIGAILGGAVITMWGTSRCFQIYAAISLLLLIVWFALNRFLKVDHGPIAGVTEQDAGGHLAPHGIPMAVPYQPKSNAPAQYAAQQGYQQQQYDPTQDAYDKYVAGN